MKITRDKTNRGFKLLKFLDRYGVECSLQASSLATDSAIWLGVHHVAGKIMACDAPAAGVSTDQTTGWVDYPIPKEVLISTRMHLTRKQVKRLLPILQKFVETGDL